MIEEAKKRLKDPDLIIDLYDQTVVWASERQYGLSGYTEEDLLTTNIRDRFEVPGDPDEWMKEHLLKDAGTAEIVLIRKDGRKVPVRITFRHFSHYGEYMVIRVRPT